MNKREKAKRLLEFFNKDGSRWANHATVKGDTRRCLIQATEELFGATSDLDMDKEFAKRLGLSLSNPNWSADVGHWNDEQKWPTIKRLLNSIRDGRKYTGPKAT